MTALIALDYINDMVTETGKAAIAYPEVDRRDVIKKLNASPTIARGEGWQVNVVIIAIDEHCLPAESQLSTILSKAGACQFGSPNVELASDVIR